jgi:hypothetical protein
MKTTKVEEQEKTSKALSKIKKDKLLLTTICPLQ